MELKGIDKHMNTGSNKYKFQTLTPTGNADISGYREALDFVFDKPNGLRNIAVTGAYSAGKSSIIETYKRENSTLRFLHISLAHFEQWNVAKDGDTDGNSINDSALEGKIINQLIHQIPYEKIPQTQFKVKRKLSSLHLRWGTVLIAALVVFLVFLFNIDSWATYVGGTTTPWLKSILSYTINDVFSFLVLLTVICIVTYFIYYAMRIQFNKNVFRKLTVQGNEIEIFSNQEDSYFDKYLNEILYLFENSDHQIFIFEDMDRFNDNRIFEKLREINTLLNKKSDNAFWFVYLLRDDMFTSKDRTKFFDFLIPIVPVVDGSNSYDQFLKHFEAGEILQHFDINFLQGISLYIDDMRLLKNIYNEYVIYHERIQSTELSSDKLLSIITYKNLFPRDFSELQLNRGFVYRLFISKESFIEEEIRELHREIQIRKQKIKSSDEEVISNLDELDAIYLNTDRLFSDGRRESHFQSRSVFIKSLKSLPDRVSIASEYQGNQQFNFNDHYKKLLDIDEYVVRKESIKNKGKEVSENLHYEIHNLQNQLRKVKDKRLKGIVSKTNINKIFAVNFTNEIGEEEQFLEVKSSPYFSLVKYLVRNGYIDETYPDYMTYFYENSLSRTDKIFLRSITDEIAKEFTYPIKNKDLIILRLKSSNFDYEEILNFDLLDYLLEHKHAYLQRFINQLKVKIRLDFIHQYFDNERENRLFIQELNRTWPSLWKEISNSSLFSEQDIKQYVLRTLQYSTNQEIKGVNEEGSFTSYISNMDNFLNVVEPDLKLLIEKFDLLNVKFIKIDYDQAHPQLFREVYLNDQYEINFNMILIILQNIYGYQNEENWKHKNFSLVTSRPDEGLTKYIRANFSTYLNVILEHCDERILDREEVSLEILNNTQVTVEQRAEYLNYLGTLISDIRDVQENKFWSMLIEDRKVEYSIDNILSYYFEFVHRMSDELTSFINQGSSVLSFDYDYISSNYEEQNTQDFYDSIIVTENLTDNKYEMLLAGYDHVINELAVEGLPQSKVNILIKLSIIAMNEGNLEFMREHYSENISVFILSDIEKYIYEVISEDNFDFSELLFILRSEIKDKHKIHLLQYTDQPISLQNFKYSDGVEQHIVSNNLNVNDIPSLIKGYEYRMTEFKQKILVMCVTKIRYVLTYASDNIIPFDLFVSLIEADRIQKADKSKLLILSLRHLTIKQVQKCYDLLQMHNFIGLFDGKRPKLERSEENKAILEVMKDRGWIYSFEIDQREDEYFRARGKKIT